MRKRLKILSIQHLITRLLILPGMEQKQILIIVLKMLWKMWQMVERFTLVQGRRGLLMILQRICLLLLIKV